MAMYKTTQELPVSHMHLLAVQSAVKIIISGIFAVYGGEKTVFSNSKIFCAIATLWHKENIYFPSVRHVVAKA